MATDMLNATCPWCGCGPSLVELEEWPTAMDGDFMFCRSCGRTGVVHDWEIRKPDLEERFRIICDLRIAQVHQFWWFSQRR